MTDFILNARHATALASGRTVAPGARTAGVDPDDSHDAALIAAGVLVELPSREQLTGKALEERARDLDIEGRSQMTADELRSAIADAQKTTNTTTEPEEAHGPEEASA